VLRGGVPGERGGVRLLVIDNGSKSIGVLTRRLRLLGADVDVLHYGSLCASIPSCNGVVLSGTTVPAFSKTYEAELAILASVDVPVFGICGGLHLLARATGVDIELGEAAVGATRVTVEPADLLFAGLPPVVTLFQRHCYRLPRVPSEFICIASSRHCPVEAMRHVHRPLWGLQAHPEFRQDGLHILCNFVRIVSRRRQHVDERVGSTTNFRRDLA